MELTNKQWITNYCLYDRDRNKLFYMELVNSLLRWNNQRNHNKQAVHDTNQQSMGRTLLSQRGTNAYRSASGWNQPHRFRQFLSNQQRHFDVNSACYSLSALQRTFYKHIADRSGLDCSYHCSPNRRSIHHFLRSLMGRRH